LEDLVRPDDVERGQAVEQHGGDLHGVCSFGQPASAKRRR
jgi:hypothetical protein